MSEPVIATPSGRQTALVAVGQGAVMVFGGVLALLVAQLFGKSEQTDAFLAAYGFYSLGITFTQSFRLTAVSSLVQSDVVTIVMRLIGASALIALVLGIPMVVFADQVGGLLVAHDPTAVAPASLRILWFAMAGQLLGSMLAAILTVRGAITPLAIATMLVGAVSVTTFLLLESSVGITAAAIGLAVGGLWLAITLFVVLLRDGWAPHRPTRTELRQMGGEAGRLSYASLTFLGATLTYVICVALATRQGAGEATLFVYGYVLGGILLGVTANVSAMVHSAAVVSRSDRVAETAGAAAWTLRFTLILAGPVLAMALVIGRPILGLALGSSFADADITEILEVLVCLTGWLVGTAAAVFAVVELLARHELTRLALLAAAQVVLLVPLALAGAALGGTQGIAAALSVTVLLSSGILVRWAFGDHWRRTAQTMGRDSLRQLLLLAAAFGPAAALLLASGESTAAYVAGGLLATVLSAALTRIAWPSEWAALLGAVR